MCPSFRSPALPGRVWRRRLGLPYWLMRNGVPLVREVVRVYGVYCQILGDVGTVGMILAFFLRKRLLVRHANNWLEQRTVVERLERRFLELVAGGRIVVLATGESDAPPSRRNPRIRWLFSTSLTQQELGRYAVPRQRWLSRLLRLISVANQEEAKGTGILIESLPIIRQEMPNLGLDVVGDGSALRKFQRRAGELRLHEMVRFHGLVDHERVIHLLGQADVFCLPTAHSEGFPKAVLEALASGLPVAVTGVSVLPRLLGSGCGVLIEERTPRGVAKAVSWCLSEPDRYRRMSIAALATARAYSLDRWSDTLRDLLEAAWGSLRSAPQPGDDRGSVRGDPPECV